MAREKDLGTALAIGFARDGILVLAGKTRNIPYRDQTVLDRIFWFLDHSNEQHVSFDYMLVDFHSHGRRRRAVKIIVRQELLAHQFVEVIPCDRLRAFHWALPVKKQNKLSLFLSRQSNLLVSVAEGQKNKELHSLLQTQKDSQGNDLNILEVPIVNLFQSGTSRKDFVQKVFVYTIQWFSMIIAGRKLLGNDSWNIQKSPARFGVGDFSFILSYYCFAWNNSFTGISFSISITVFLIWIRNEGAIILYIRNTVFISIE